MNKKFRLETNQKQQQFVIMGNQQCKQCKETKIQNFSYGSYQLLREEREIYALVEKPVDSSDQSLKKIVEDQLRIRKSLINNHVVKLFNYKLVDTQYGFKTIMQFQYIGKTLRDRKNQLKQKNLQFTERQLFAITYGIQSALQQMSKNKIKHNCINLDTILCKNNAYKITDVSSTTYITSYDLVLKGNKQQFLSERVMNNLSNKSLSPIYQLKDDLFSLGLIVLMIASGKEPQYYYKWSENGTGFLRISNIDSSFKEIHSKYSSKLIKKLRFLIYQYESSVQEDETNLTEDLIQLDEEMIRVMNRAKKMCEKVNSSQNQTLAGTPERSSNYLSKRLKSSFQIQQ